MTTRTPAEVFPPGEFIREELQERGWTQADLARILGRPLSAVNQIINGKKAITADTARQLSEAFGTSAQLWLNLEATYRLSLARDPAGDIRRYAELYEVAPVKELEKRGWVEPTGNVKASEEELKRFFDVESFDNLPELAVAARKTDAPEAPLTAAQYAWCRRVLELGSRIQAESFSKAKLIEGLPSLAKLAEYAEEARNVPRLLGKLGVRLVIVEHLPGCRIDGAVLWLGPVSPVVGLSMRYDRIDYFWFTLCHELAHILDERKGGVLDEALIGERGNWVRQLQERERKANEHAAAMLVSPDALESFVFRVKPYFSKERIVEFARDIHVHPGVIVGQLQCRGEVGYWANREMLVSIREIVLQQTMTDGWGKTAGVG